MAALLISGAAAADRLDVTSQDMSIGFGNGCTFPEAVAAVNSGSNFSGCNFVDDSSDTLSIVLPDGDYEATDSLTFTADAVVYASPAAVLHTDSEWGIGVTGNGNGTPVVILNGLSVEGADAQPTPVVGLYADGGATLVARNVTVTRCDEAGILINDSTLEMDNSDLLNNGVGLQLLGGEATLLNNSITDNSGDGMFVDAATVEVQSTYFNLNGGNGIQSTGTGPVFLTNSNLAGNEGDGAMLAFPTEYTPSAEHQFIADGCLFQGNVGSGFSNSHGLATLRDSQLSGNTNSGLRNGSPDGAGGETFCLSCTIRDNSANFGGGIWNGPNPSSKVHIINSAVFDNVALTDGGGMFSLGQPYFSSSTFSGNLALRDGGGLYITGNELTMWHTTITNNQALGKTGGMYANASQPRINYSIIAGNQALIDPDLDGYMLNGLYTLVGEAYDESDWNPFGSPEGMQFGVDPELDALKHVNGLTWAHSPLAGSPVVDAIPVDKCVPFNGNEGSVDQRGLGRPIGTGCDIGAIERGESGALPLIEALNWTSNVTLSLNSQRHTQGSFGLNVGGSGYRVVNSGLFHSVPRVGSSMSLDVFVPGSQPNPYWLGAVQMFGTCAAAGLYNVYLGQQELTGRPTGQFSTLSFNVPDNLRTALAQQGNCFLSVAVNTNATPTAPVLDNLRF